MKKLRMKWTRRIALLAATGVAFQVSGCALDSSTISGLTGTILTTVVEALVSSALGSATTTSTTTTP